MRCPFESEQHDSKILNQSGLLNDLWQVAFYNGEPFCLYGYRLGIDLQGPYKNPNWLFGNITNSYYFKLIGFKRQMKINLVHSER